jgi:hypothetical protein
MKKGGAPTGKRLTTALAEREKRERDNPSLKERRQEEERAKQRRFLASMSGDKPLLTSSSTNISTASDAGMDSELSTNILTTGAACTPSDTPHVGSAPSLPKTKQDRLEDTLYTHHYSGRDVIVRWKQTGGLILCTCDQASTTLCTGGVRVDRCGSLASSAAHNVLGGSRPKARCDYAAIQGGFAPAASGCTANVARNNLYAGEVERIENLREILPSDGGDRGLVVCKQGRWNRHLMQFQSWTFHSNAVSFPL